MEDYCRDLDASAVEVTSETDDGPADSVLRPNTFEFWEAQETPAVVKIDLGFIRPMDYVGIVAERSAVTIETSTNDSDYTQFAPEVYPADDAPLMALGSM